MLLMEARPLSLRVGVLVSTSVEVLGSSGSCSGWSRDAMPLRSATPRLDVLALLLSVLAVVCRGMRGSDASVTNPNEETCWYGVGMNTAATVVCFVVFVHKCLQKLNSSSLQFGHPVGIVQTQTPMG